jgi:hypothetical protein
MRVGIVRLKDDARRPAALVRSFENDNGRKATPKLQALMSMIICAAREQRTAFGARLRRCRGTESRR